MSIKLTFFLTLICTNFIFAQSTSTISRSNSVIWSGTIPSRLSSGPMDVSFSVEYHFARNPSTNELILHYKIRNIKYDYRYSELRFKQDDVIYRPNDLDKIDGLKSEGFDDIDITSLKANVDVSSTGGGPSFSASNVSLSSHYLNRIVGNNISKDLILNNLTISFNQLDDLSFTNTTKLRNRINNSKNATTAKKSGSYTSKPLVVASSSETKTSKNSTATKSDKKDEKKTTTSDYSNYVPEKTKEQQVTELVQSGNQLLNNIAADMEATRIKNEATAKRERERRARNASAGKALLDKNLATHLTGKKTLWKSRIWVI